MAAVNPNRKERLLLDVLVTTVQKDALLSVIKALDIDVTERVLSKEEEDIALMVAMEEGLKSGIATEQEKNDFESFLSGNSLSSMSIPRHFSLKSRFTESLF
ncbi:MAG TPA: hypothetical protein VN038_12110 [Dyadobacter sp.]|nr:hypothetical protein [Dyadobacter sp.]